MIEINQIYNIDCDQGMEQLDDESIDFILTDPPYGKKYCKKAYSTLAKHAFRILKPSKFLVTYCGQYHIVSIMNILLESKLEYFWLFLQLNKESKSIIWSRNVMAGFKPILIYQKPPFMPLNKPSIDIIHGKKSKKYHQWEQSLYESFDLISTFANPHDLVLDPFAGSGTSLLAAKLLGMNYIGFEIDENTTKIAKQRLSQEVLIYEDSI